MAHCVGVGRGPSHVGKVLVVGLWHRYGAQVRTMLISPANEVLLCPMITLLALDIKQ